MKLRVGNPNQWQYSDIDHQNLLLEGHKIRRQIFVLRIIHISEPTNIIVILTQVSAIRSLIARFDMQHSFFMN